MPYVVYFVLCLPGRFLASPALQLLKRATKVLEGYKQNELEKKERINYGSVHEKLILAFSSSENSSSQASSSWQFDASVPFPLGTNSSFAKNLAWFFSAYTGAPNFSKTPKTQTRQNQLEFSGRKKNGVITKNQMNYCAYGYPPFPSLPFSSLIPCVADSFTAGVLLLFFQNCHWAHAWVETRRKKEFALVPPADHDKC